MQKAITMIASQRGGERGATMGQQRTKEREREIEGVRTCGLREPWTRIRSWGSQCIHWPWAALHSWAGVGGMLGGSWWASVKEVGEGWVGMRKRGLWMSREDVEQNKKTKEKQRCRFAALSLFSLFFTLDRSFKCRSAQSNIKSGSSPAWAGSISFINSVNSSFVQNLQNIHFLVCVINFRGILHCNVQSWDWDLVPPYVLGLSLTLAFWRVSLF